MKQHITPKQACEVSKDDFYIMFPELVIRDDWSKFHHKKITVGRLIELTAVGHMSYDHYINGWNIGSCESKYTSYEYPRLCDALWEYTKCELSKL